ncbi:MBL fold metallo-hydrolase [Haloarchaeobius sp. HRN-SO-5]|uniref:MBL fold metallo-hydrolase n=1 Tax=Haloarchaeobius sp. HRN-SO-5 TaxID=3446118 RepID=UPI003EBE18FF
MQVSFQHANPHSGNESVLVRFTGGVTGQSACVLVDSGTGVDLDALLRDDEYLTAIVLTHAHLDHYETLGESVRDGAPIYAAEPTAAILDDVLTEATSNYDVTNVDDVLDALTPVTDWTTVLGDVEVRPVPAGHAPGAAGFLFRFDDGGDPHTMLATGDWTRRRVAGFPGLPTTLSPEALVLTGATRDGFSAELTDAVSTIVERARAGSSVLVTASGLVGVHLAYLIASLETAGVEVPSVSIVGHAAKLYDTLGYDHPAVTSVPRFGDPDRYVGPGTVTVAGPEVPVEGSARRLYGQIRDDPGATLVQVTSGPASPVESARCTVDRFQYSNHPTEETVDGLVEDLAPNQVVVTHQTGTGLSRYKDRYDSFVWATTDADEYTIYDDGRWTKPPWVNDRVARRLRSRQYGNGGQLGVLTDTGESLPAVERAGVDLEAEGLDVSALSDRFCRPSPTACHGPDADADSDESGSAALADVEDRLGRLEARLGANDAGGAVDVRVVDAGDGDRFLWVLDGGETLAHLGHGDEVTVRLDGDG